MKKLMLIIASLFLATSVASANPSQQMDFTSINKADSQFLFDGSAKAIALSSTEMKQTEGEFWPLLFRIGYRVAFLYGGYANAPTFNSRIRTGVIGKWWR